MKGIVSPAMNTPPVKIKTAMIRANGRSFGWEASSGNVRLTPQRLQYFNPSTESIPQDEQYIDHLHSERPYSLVSR
jgi:hypothetical protein